MTVVGGIPPDATPTPPDETPLPAGTPGGGDEHDPGRDYVRVIVVWVLVLAALFAFQEYFG